MEKSKRGAGGTPGGIGEFLFGTMLVVAGGYLFLNQVQVRSQGFGFRVPFGGGGGFTVDSFGLSLIPLLIGIGLLFFNGRSLPGWFLTVAGSVIIVLGVLARLTVNFRPTSLFNTLLMLGMLAAGLGLVSRSLKDHDAFE